MQTTLHFFVYFWLKITLFDYFNLPCAYKSNLIETRSRIQFWYPYAVNDDTCRREKIKAAHLTLATLLELFHPCCLSNVNKDK